MLNQVNENLILTDSMFIKQKEYWINKLSGDIPKTVILSDYRKSHRTKKDKKIVDIFIQGDLNTQLMKVSRKSDPSLYLILLATLKTLIYRYTGNVDVTVVSPIYKPHAHEQTLNDRLFIRNRVSGDMTFRELLLDVRQSTLEAYEKQDYPFEKLIHYLNPNRVLNSHLLSDICCLLQNIHDDGIIDRIETTLVFSFIREEQLKGIIIYDPGIYEDYFINQLARHFVKSLEFFLKDSSRKVAGISFLSEKERQRLIFEFNDTTTGYPREKTIHELFEEQVERTPYRTALIETRGLAPLPDLMSITYRELNKKSNLLAGLLIEKGVQVDTIVGILVERSIEMIIGILGILKAGGAYLPIDPHYPQERIDFMLKDSNTKVILAAPGTQGKVKLKVKLINLTSTLRVTSLTLTPAPTSKLVPLAASSAYIMYTSGSTGKPKGVIVEHRAAVNYIQWAKKVYLQEEKCDFPLYSALSFDLTVTSIYVPLVSGNKIVVYGEDDGEFVVTTILKQSSVQLIKLTPTHLNIIRTCDDIGKIAVKKWIVGGENLTTALAAGICEKFQRYIPLEIYNEYGPTETTVGCMIYKYDPAKDNKPSVPIGMPADNVRVYLMDRNRQPVPVGVAAEIYISGDGVARGYLNQPQLTAAKFLPDPFITGKRMYKSGDMGRRMPNGNILFLGRIDHQVKIRGYRIELGEIESHLFTHRQIKKTVVIAKEDQKKDKFLCGYFVADVKLTVPVLREHLLKKLPGYMIPSYFVQLEKIPLTAHGKIDRKALPHHQTGEATEEYIPPTNEVEEKLTNIWAEILEMKKEKISINSNFFELGGHSLKATILAARIRKKFNVEYPLNHVFKSPTIKESADFISQRKKSIHREIQLVEKKEYHPSSSAQKRLFFLQQLENIGTAYNMTKMLKIKGAFNKQRLHSAVNRLIERHESLRTSFELIRNEPVQRIHDSLDFKIEEIVVSHDKEFSPGDKENKKSPPWLKNFIRPFDLSIPPLLRVALVVFSPDEHILLYDMHHIIGDGTSRSILVDDFICLYTAEEPLPLRIQYKDFSCWQNRLFATGKIKEQEEYWMNLYSDTSKIPGLNVQADYPRPAVLSFKGDIYDFVFAGEDAERFQELGAAYGATLYMNLLASFNILLYKYTGQEDIIVGTGVMGRPHADLETIVGMFVNELAMRNHPCGETTYSDFLNEVKTNCLQAYENQDLQFEELVDKLDLTRDPSRNPLFDVCLVVNNFENPKREMKDTVFVPLEWKRKTSKFDITLFASQGDNDVYFRLEYSTALFKKETIRRFTHHYLNIMKQVGKQPGIRTADIEILSASEKKQLLKDFNHTDVPFLGDKTLHGLVEEQIEKCADKIAVGFGPDAFTYRHLGENANRLANYLAKGKQVRPDDRVGILMESSIQRITAILGILKAGAAYLPIDFSLPQERVKNMMDDACIEILLSQKKFINTLNRLQWECGSFHTYLCLDSSNICSEDETEKSQLMDKKLWEHVGRTASDEITGGGWHSSYTGEPFSREEMEEYGQNILKKLMPLLHKDMRVLEIGCASGISMYRIAPRVGFYYGTDLSNVIIERNKEQVEREGHDNIDLACLQAHEIDQIREKLFDLVIINSVIQCFHGHNYLRKVIGKAIDLLADKGYLFIGDIMDQELKADLVRSLKDFKRNHKNKKYRTKTDVSAELFVSRAFFQDLARDLSPISDIEFSQKIYTLENELTQFRYDALIKIDKNRWVAGKSKTPDKHKYQDDLKELGKYSINNPNSPVEPDHLAYLIYTSGSTGVPKAVAVEHRGTVNMLVCRRDEYKLTPVDVSLQLFSYAFDGFITGLFTPLISGTRVLLLSEEQIKDVMAIDDVIAKNRVTHFIVVPALFRAILETTGKESLSSLKVVTLAGDKLLPDLVEAALDKNKNLEIVNEYGITECSVMSTLYRGQQRENLISIGKPIWNTKIYIIDNDNKLVPIGVPGELCIAGVGLAREYLGNPELTAEKFIPSPFVEGERLYKTGDAARWLADGNIELVGRRDRQIKIRGFRIELGEIESRLLKHEEVVRAAVIAKENKSGDSSICAYIVSANELKINDLEEYLSTVLPGYMIPSHFVQLQEMPLTPSGKLDRQALLKVETKPGGQYTPPRHAVDEKMAAIWSEVLGVEKGIIGIDDDFFHLGGHSLKAVLLVSRIHQLFNIKVPLTEIFKTPTIKGLSDYIQSREKGAGAYTSIEPVEKREYYMLSPAQKRMYIIQQMDENSTSYNISSTIVLGKDFDKDKLEGIFLNLIKRHESLRTSFMMQDEVPVQQVHDEVEFEIEYDQSLVNCQGRGVPGGAPINVPSPIKVEKAIRNFVRPFNLSMGPLLRVGALKTGEKQWTLLVDMHHIISDGVSQIILERDFMAFVEGMRLPPFKIQYRDFSQWQNSEQKRENIKKQEMHWLKEFAGQIPTVNLPTDYPRPTLKSFEGSNTRFEIERDETNALKKLSLKQGATLFMTLLAIFNILLGKLSSQEDIIIGTAAAGRQHKDLEKIVGMFVNTLALRNFPKGEKTFTDFLKEVKKRTLQAFENQDYQFQDLVEKVAPPRDPGCHPLFDVLMALHNTEVIPGNIFKINNRRQELKRIPNMFERKTVKFDMMWNVVEIENKLIFSVEYCTKLFKKKTIERFIDYFNRIMRTVIEIPTKKLSEIEIMSHTEKRILVKKIRKKKDKLFIEEAEMVQYQEKEMTADFDF